MKQMIWIRVENEADWKSIVDKSAFVNDALRNHIDRRAVQRVLREVPMPAIAATKKDYGALQKKGIKA